MYRITGNFVESIDPHTVRAVRRFSRRDAESERHVLCAADSDLQTVSPPSCFTNGALNVKYIFTCDKTG